MKPKIAEIKVKGVAFLVEYTLQGKYDFTIEDVKVSGCPCFEDVLSVNYSDLENAMEDYLTEQAVAFFEAQGEAMQEEEQLARVAG